ncbi:MAG: chorismate synthase [Nitrospinota bacterium]|nr:chorismate synthase [Nitrospinota bacterium]
MPGNTFGTLLRLTTWGESHGAAIGGVLDGCPSGIELSEADMQVDLDRRKPGQSRHASQRKEPDTVEILSGLFEGKTTGAPISFLIKNRDKDSSAYEDIKNLYRPGHADLSYDMKYGFRDYRGGGRSSARETAVRVAAGAIAKKIIAGIKVTGYTIQIDGVRAETFSEEEIEKNPVRSPDPKAAEEMEKIIDLARKAGDSVGGIVEVTASNVPPGLGQPVYGKISADLASALMSINAIKGVEIGAGFACASMKGSEFNDPITAKGGKFTFKSNNAGGILGGITSGQDIVVRIAVKPTPSILKEQETVDKDGKSASISVTGRHDPCICPRVVPVAEAMVALVLADHILIGRSSRI